MTIPRLNSLSLLLCASACLPGTKSLGGDTAANDGDVVAESSSSGAMEEETIGASSVAATDEGGATGGEGTDDGETSPGTGGDCDADSCTCPPECKIVSACFAGALQCGCDCDEDPVVDPEACEIMWPPAGSCSTGAGDERPDLPQIALPAPLGLAPAAGPQAGGIPQSCDTYAQDCPESERCVPWSDDGSAAFTATGCFPIADAPHAIGEDCLVIDGGANGEDTCGEGAICWDPDPETSVGTCVELCGCSESNPICETDNTICVTAPGGVLALCLGLCNPLDVDGCGPDRACYPYDDGFVCAPDVSQGTAVGEPCAFINTCPAGSACVDETGEPIQGPSEGTCVALCELGASECGADTCAAWYEGDAPDACLGTVGACQ